MSHAAACAIQGFEGLREGWTEGLAKGLVQRVIGSVEPTPMARAAERHAGAVFLGR